jgi:hypothetical protein
VLYAEAINILNKLLIRPSTGIVRELWARFYVLQEYFAMRYHEARAYAIAALGHVEAAIAFPQFTASSGKSGKYLQRKLAISRLSSIILGLPESLWERLKKSI